MFLACVYSDISARPFRVGSIEYTPTAREQEQGPIQAVPLPLISAAAIGRRHRPFIQDHEHSIPTHLVARCMHIAIFICGRDTSSQSRPPASMGALYSMQQLQYKTSVARTNNKSLVQRPRLVLRSRVTNRQTVAELSPVIACTKVVVPAVRILLGPNTSVHMPEQAAQFLAADGPASTISLTPLAKVE
jgi:hypothetical protein